MDEIKGYAIHEYINSDKNSWKRDPKEVLSEHGIDYEIYEFSEDSTRDTLLGYLYAYETDPLTNALIFCEIGVTDDCLISEIEVPC